MMSKQVEKQIADAKNGLLRQLLSPFRRACEPRTAHMPVQNVRQVQGATSWRYGLTHCSPDRFAAIFSVPCVAAGDVLHFYGCIREHHCNRDRNR